jgi:hypothetical protein
MTLTVETWCEALDSGRYKQAPGRLRNVHVDGFCCLGVACDLSGTGTWDDEGYFVANDSGRFEGSCLPIHLLDVLGLNTDTGTFEVASLPGELQAEIIALYTKTDDEVPSVCELTSMNDRGASFPLIAKVIRARPKGLFREDAA